jgi:hypothetical protein
VKDKSRDASQPLVCCGLGVLPSRLLSLSANRERMASPVECSQRTHCSLTFVKNRKPGAGGGTQW